MIEQGTDAWKALRCGKATASKMADLTARTKTGWGASRANYAAQLVAERLTGTVAESFTNAAMQWGTEKEPEARAAYEFYRNCDVEQVPFVDHPRIGMSGASPDGLIGSVGLVEIKCPQTATHIETILAGNAVDTKYVKQIQWQLACTGRQWCDFASYDCRMPENLRLHIVRVERDPRMIADLESMVAEFLSEVSATVEALKARAA